jgi:hypothetical protein
LLVSCCSFLPHVLLFLLQLHFQSLSISHQLVQPTDRPVCLVLFTSFAVQIVVLLFDPLTLFSFVC